MPKTKFEIQVTEAIYDDNGKYLDSRTVFTQVFENLEINKLALFLNTPEVKENAK